MGGYNGNIVLRDRVRNLAENSCRVPVVIRIVAYQLFAQYEPMEKSEKTKNLCFAWKLCHNVKTTPVIIHFMRRTQRLWGELGLPLGVMPSHKVKPPGKGYAVVDSSRCLSGIPLRSQMLQPITST